MAVDGCLQFYVSVRWAIPHLRRSQNRGRVIGGFALPSPYLRPAFASWDEERVKAWRILKKVKAETVRKRCATRIGMVANGSGAMGASCRHRCRWRNLQGGEHEPPSGSPLKLRIADGYRRTPCFFPSRFAPCCNQCLSNCFLNKNPTGICAVPKKCVSLHLDRTGWQYSAMV